jgi:hypothetical protein
MIKQNIKDHSVEYRDIYGGEDFSAEQAEQDMCEAEALLEDR